MTNKKHVSKYTSEDFLEYLKQYGRKMVDPTASKGEDHAWHPANYAAQKLWRCVEALRDIYTVLGDAAASTTSDTQARKLKILATPMYSLLCAVLDLCNDLLSNPATMSRLHKSERKNVAHLSNAIIRWFPLDKDSPLRVARDKTSAHIEAKLRPAEVRAILAKAPAHKYGRWLHQSIIILLELTSYNVYAWTADAPERCERLMTNEPFGVVIENDPKLGKVIREIEISWSPRNDVNEICQQVVLASEWMFMPGQHCIAWSDKEHPRINLKADVMHDTYQSIAADGSTRLR